MVFPWGLLTSAPKGRAGGELTELAIEILKEHAASLKEEEEKIFTKSTTIYTSEDDIPCTWADNTAAGFYYSGV